MATYDTTFNKAAALLARGWNYEDPQHNLGKPVTKEAFVSSITLAMVSITVVSFCLARRLVGVSCYKGLPLARWCKFPVQFMHFMQLMHFPNTDVCRSNLHNSSLARAAQRPY